MAMNAYRNLTTSEGSLSKSLERLSSGYRINRAADDAAGLVISEGLRSQVMGLKMATRNAQDGVSVVQTAEGALTETHSILQRMRELAVQAASTGSSDQPSRDAAQVEVGQLQNELNRIAATTQFGAQILLDGSYGVTQAVYTGINSVNPATQVVAAGDDFTITVGAGPAVTVDLTAIGAGGFDGTDTDTIQSYLENAINGALAAAGQDPDGVTVTVASSLATGAVAATPYKVTLTGADAKNIALADGTGTPLADFGLVGAGVTNVNSSGSGGVFQVGSGISANDKINITIGAVDATTLGVSSAVVNVATNTSTVNINAIDTAITTVSTLRGNLGAYQNRFEHTIANLSITTENLSASESRIRDTDMAAEMMAFTRAQILQQAGTAMLAQANAVPQSVLQLLQK
jgi:flagellin